MVTTLGLAFGLFFAATLTVVARTPAPEHTHTRPQDTHKENAAPRGAALSAVTDLVWLQHKYGRVCPCWHC